MTAELVRGQNHPVPGTRLEIRVSAGKPIVAGATVSDDHRKVRGTSWVAHPGAPTLPGLEVSRQAAADHRLAVDLGALPDGAHQVNVLLALPVGVAGPVTFGAVAAPFVAVTGLDGTEIASYTITDLSAESAVVALELYRKQDVWKVRAVGQGYAGGLADMLADQGLPEAQELATAINDAVARGLARSVAAPPPRPADETRVRAAAQGHTSPGRQPSAPEPGPDTAAQPVTPTPAPGEGGQPPQPVTPASGDATPPAQSGDGGPVNYTHPRRQTSAPPPPPPTAPPAAPGQPARPVAGDATGWSMEERLYNQVWGMFEDLARSAAAYRSAVDFADSRMEQELDKVLSDPRSRIGGTGDAARETARARHGDLVDQARAALDRDLAQLAAEVEVVEPALPPAFADWSSPVWHGYRVPMEIPMALRLGGLHLPERPDLRIPMLVRLPLERGLWIDSGRSGTDSLADADQLRRLALDSAVAHAARLLAAYPPGAFTVHVIDAAGSGTSAFAPLVSAGVLDEPPTTGAAGATAVLTRLTQRVDLVQMAVRGGMADALPQDLDTGEHLLIVNDFPHGFDDRAVTQLRYLADEGPAVGVHLMMVADREDAREYGPLLDPLWRALMRLTPVPDDHLADPWVGHAWTYEPPLPPSGSQVLHRVLGTVGTSRRKGGR
ncbi:TerD family protein [Streptomyces sp. NPDC127108]|uniref:TerD family protein n=1 Tax=Streptomyces sp. NPDC127108 TaxID=3345361 RepID=UPI003643582F